MTDIRQSDREAAEPVAYMYHHPGDIENGWQRYSFERRIQSYEGMSCIEEDAGVIETPLFTRAQIEAETIAKVVAWLREQAEVAQAKAEAAILADNDRGARDYFAGKITANNSAAAIENGDWRNDL